METQIDRDARVVLDALALAPRDASVVANVLRRHTGLEPVRLNDAVALLVDSGYAEWIQETGTAPFDFAEVTITSRGRYEHQRLKALRSKGESLGAAREVDVAQSPGEITGDESVPARPPSPVGSPYGFTDEDWELVAERKAKADRVYGVLGHQFESTFYRTEELRGNIQLMLEQAVAAYNDQRLGAPVTLDYRPLAAGYGEHLFNEIARDIISADVAVFETSDLNPNVMLEMGVALTWGVRVLPIKAEGRQRPPSDVSGQTWADYTDSGSRFIDPDHRSKLVRMVERAIRKKGKRVF